MFDRFCGQGSYTALYCGQGELFRVKELAGRTDEYLSDNSRKLIEISIDSKI